MDKKIEQDPKTESSAEALSKEASSVIWVSFWKNKNNFLFLSTILLISFIVYLPSLQNGFVNWDDGVNIYENSNIINISNWDSFIENAKGIFTSSVIGNYNPLAILTFAFEKMLYGLGSPEWWHLDNIILHLICVLLVFRIALAIGLKIIPAAFCALLFGIHPMRVESVAWITERKDVLYGSFYLLALYYYIKSVKLSFQKRYVLIILSSFILALLSKIQAVTFPLSMLLVDYYFGRKLSMKLIYEKWLYFLLSLITGGAGIYLLGVHGSSGINEKISLFKVRIFYGSYSYVTYIIKSVVPYKMVPVYPFPSIISGIFYASMALALFILVMIFYFFLKKKKELVFGLLFFTCNIVFLLQIKLSGQAFLADRFTYIAYLGLFFIYAFGVQWALERYKRYNRLIYLTAFFILGVFGYMNFEQNKIWKNSDTLWTHVLKYYPGENIWKSRAEYYKNHGRFEEALHDYNEAIALDPNDLTSLNNRGLLLSATNQLEKLKLALQDQSKAIKLSPGKSKYWFNRAVTHFKLKNFNYALQDLVLAERLDPTNHEIYFYKSNIFSNLGQFEKAQPEIEKYLTLDPSNSDMWTNLGEISRLNKQYDRSVNAFNKAIQLNPDKLLYYNSRLKTYYEMGNIELARYDLNFLKSKGFKGINQDYERLLNLEK